VQRDSYRETMDLLRLEQLDFAWVCAYPMSTQAAVAPGRSALYLSQPYYRGLSDRLEKEPAGAGPVAVARKVFGYAIRIRLPATSCRAMNCAGWARIRKRSFPRRFFTYSHAS